MKIENNIVGEILLECDKNVLKDLGIGKVGDRIRIQQSLKYLRAQSFTVKQPPILLSSNASLASYQDTTMQRVSHVPSPQASLFGGDSDTATPNRYQSLAKSMNSFSAPATTVEVRTQYPDAAPVVSKILSMEAIKQSTVKFIYNQGITKSFSVAECSNGEAVKKKAMKKIGVKNMNETWAVFIAENLLGTVARQVSDQELFTICHSPDRQERNRLMLCAATGSGPSKSQLAKSQQLIREFAGSVQVSPVPFEPPKNNDNDYNDIQINDTYTDFDDTLHSLEEIADPGIGLTTKEEVLNTDHDNSTKKRLRKFFGQRPPSELISHNLQEYFPEAGPAVLKETIRKSIMYKRTSRLSRISPRSSIALAYQNYEAVITPALVDNDSVPPSQQDNVRPVSNVSMSSAFSIQKSPTTLALSDRYMRRSRNSDNAFLRVPSFTQWKSEHRQSIKGETVEARQEEEEEEEERLQLEALDELDGGNTINEEEFAEELDQEKMGPSRWIKGTLIGSGSFGTVYLGMNSITGELMAVKQVELARGNKETEQRKQAMLDAMEREMNLLRDMQHENIVQYLGSNSEGNFLNIFLEYVPGGSVATMLSKYGAFEEPLVRNFVRQILHGLKYLHDRNIIHRDIKGANVLVDNKGGIKISDFGISKKLEERLLTGNSNTGSDSETETEINHRVSLQGSVYWMAPEVVKQTSYTLKADIWSLGCLIVEMFTGTHPFPEFSQMQAIFKIGTSSTPAMPPGCSEEARDFLTQAFEIDYTKRPTAEKLLKQPFLKPML